MGVVARATNDFHSIKADNKEGRGRGIKFLIRVNIMIDVDALHLSQSLIRGVCFNS